MITKTDILHWLFQIIVNHLEQYEENARPFVRLETNDNGLDLFTTNGKRFQILVLSPDQNQKHSSTSKLARENGIHLPQSGWEDLVDACESILEYLKSLKNRPTRGA